MAPFQAAFSSLKGLQFLVGEDGNRDVVTADLSKLHHLFLAGATGSGKSVFLDSFLLSILAHSTPEQLQLVLCDTKMLGFSRYSKTAHLLLPICTAIETVSAALEHVQRECWRRLDLLSTAQCRRVDSYNDQAWEAFLPELPRIVLVLDDISVILNARPEAENLVADLLSKGRVVGIHLIAATQTPTVKPIKRLLSLFPSQLILPLTSRAAFHAVSRQKKLPSPAAPGDALFCTGASAQPVHTWMPEETFINEVLASLPIAEKPTDTLIKPIDLYRSQEEEIKILLPAAIQVLTTEGSASTSLLQRRLKINYSTAAALRGEMERQGIISPLSVNLPYSTPAASAQLEKNPWLKTVLLGCRKHGTKNPPRIYTTNPGDRIKH